MLVSEIRDEVALHLHDVDKAEISDANLLVMLNTAVRDARNSGWLIRLEDNESLEVAASTWEYSVPASFAYVEKLLLEEDISGTSVYIKQIPSAHWEVRLNGSVPVFTFKSDEFLVTGQNLKVVGQQRPTLYTVASETIDPGMESFLRERMLFYAFRYTGAGLSELARWRQSMATMAYQTSEGFLRRHPQEFRMLPSAVEVPGRG